MMLLGKRGRFTLALDSIYRISENKKTTEMMEMTDYKKMARELKNATQDLVNHEIDQKWIKENENKENSFSTTPPKSEEEQQLDEILAKFKRIRESNNNMRSQMRKQQLTPLQQFQETQQWVDSMTGGKSR